MPTPTDLVTDLPADFEVFGQAVDTQMKTNADAATQKATLTTKGDIYAASGTSTPARVAVGTNGQVLVADSTAATGVAWATPASGGAYTTLASGSLPAGTLTLSSISSAYVDLKLVILASRTGSDGDFYRMRYNNDTGSNYTGSAAYGVNPNNMVNAQMNIFGIGQDNATANGLVIVDIPNYTNTSIWKTARAFATVNNQNTPTQVGFAYNTLFWNGTAAIDRIDVFPFSGTFATGTYILYGVK